MTTTLPTLYKLNSNGSTQQWTISVDGNILSATYGQVGGKMQNTHDPVLEGKNVGKANETTREEQALAEAQSQWEKKQKRGYNVDRAAAASGVVDASFVKGGADPMLAHSFAKRGKDIKFPACAQPKLDGHRCIAVVGDDGKVNLWSRTRKPITGVPHIIAELESQDLHAGLVLDGELYNHDYREKFEELTSFIRQENPKPGHEVVQYYIYDALIPDVGFYSRVTRLNVLVTPSPSVVLVETIQVGSVEDLEEKFSDWSADGYEGAMVRNMNSLYVGKRSKDLQKVKMMEDFEAEIVGVEEGRGRMAGKAIFVCKMGSGETFSVKMKGSLDSLRQYVTDPSLAVGKQLTVQCQGFTTYGIPRFPVGLRLRQDI